MDPRQIQTLKPDEDWALSYPGAPGYFAIGCDLRDAKDSREKGDTLHIVTRAEAVKGMQDFLDWKDSRRALAAGGEG